MGYGIQGLLDNVSKQYDDLRNPFLKCRTKSELKEALKPHVLRIANQYNDMCIGSIQMMIDSIHCELYNLEKAVYHISQFGMDTIEQTVNDIMRER